MSKSLPRWPKWMVEKFPSNSTDFQIREIIADLWPDGMFASSICKQCGRFSCKSGIKGNYLNAIITDDCAICKAEKECDEKEDLQIMG